MIKRLKAFGRVAGKTFIKMQRAMSGIRAMPTSFAAMTLDQDDVTLARDLIQNHLRLPNQEVVRNYEVEFSRWNGSKYSFAFMGGRGALSACIYALGLKPGDEVILPGYTCVVVPNAFHFAGVKTVYSDIELDTYGLDASTIEERITENTKAILLHHLYGLVCRDYKRIIEIARKHSLYVIEDCAQATGAEFEGAKVGNLGDIAFYSSEHSKSFNTIQGGVAVTNNAAMGKRLTEFYEAAPCPDEDRILRQLRNVILEYYELKHPQRWWYGKFAKVKYGKDRLVGITDEEKLGIHPPYYSFRMAGPIAALGINQLKKLDSYNKNRRKTSLKPLIVPNSTPVYLRYPVMVEPVKKKDTSWGYKELGISLGVWFVSNIHPVPWPVDGCPNANRAVKQCVNFPTLYFEK
jgi:perosamine synthetase